MSLFEKITHAKLKDCFLDEVLGVLTFIVQPSEIGKAIGKQGANIRPLERATGKKIRIIEFNEDKIRFIANMIMPLRAANIEEREEIIYITGPDTKTKGLLIGRNAQNLRNLEENVRRYFQVKEIKII